MTPRNYDIETSDLIVLQGDDGNNSYKDVWAIFDVSRTTTVRYIAIHWDRNHPNETPSNYETLTVFDGIYELLLWCAYRQAVDGAEFRTGIDQHRYQEVEWLDELARADGYDNWKQFVEETSFLRLVKVTK